MIFNTILGTPLHEVSSTVESRFDPDAVDKLMRMFKEAFDRNFPEDLHGNDSSRKQRDDWSARQIGNVESEQAPDEVFPEDKLLVEVTEEMPENFERIPESEMASYACDRYDDVSRSCVNVRQLGTTLTFKVPHGNNERHGLHHIRWYRCFKKRGTQTPVKEEITREYSPWNINIGGDNNELRVSPITETDFSFNYFMALVEIPETSDPFHKKSVRKHEFKFIIEPITIDLGVLYHGEELSINARAFMELPKSSIHLEWSFSDPDFHVFYELPSNMRLSSDASAVIVKEYKIAADKILTCAVYSNKNIFVARRSFLLRKILGSHRSMTESKSFSLRRHKRSFDENYDQEDEFEYVKPNREGIEVPVRKPDPYSMPVYDTYPDKQMYPESNDKRFFPLNRKEPPLKYAVKESQHPKSDGDIYYERYKTPEPLSVGKYYEKKRNSPEWKDDARDFGTKRDSFSKIPVEPYARVPEEQESDLQPNPHLRRLIEQANSFVESPASREKLIVKDDYVKDDLEDSSTFDDTESRLIAECRSKSDCSVHATCHEAKDGIRYCKCSPKYKGNGIFCWNI